jgi:mitochondrial fission protein ELM1
MGWTPTSFNLKFNWLNWLPNPVLGHSLVSLDGKSRQQLRPPYPDIVVGMGRRIVPVARWIKRQSGGASRIVLLGRKAAGGVSEVDIFISCIHFNQIPRQGLVELVVPLTQVDSVSLASARAARPNPISRLKHPRVVLLVGGPTAQHRFDENDASVLASAMVQATGLLGGELAIVTSRRTPAAAVAALLRAAPQAQFEVWSKSGKDNPYLSYLAHADVLAVTGESESMLAEAAATGAPLTIYPLQAKPKGFKNFLAGALRRKADENGVLAKLSRQIILAGWMSPPRDLTLMHLGMVKRGLAEIFEGALNTKPPTPTDEFEHLAQQLTRLSRSNL